MAFVETVFKGNPTPVDHELIPSAVFTQPEYGTIGLSEEDARTQEPIEVYCTSFKPMNHAFAGRSDRVMMKLIVSQATRRILGCHIVADHALPNLLLQRSQFVEDLGGGGVLDLVVHDLLVPVDAQVVVVGDNVGLGYAERLLGASPVHL